MLGFLSWRTCLGISLSLDHYQRFLGIEGHEDQKFIPANSRNMLQICPCLTMHMSKVLLVMIGISFKGGLSLADN